MKSTVLFLQDSTAARMLQNAGGREGSGWVIRDAPFVDQWSEEEYEELIRCLKHTIQCGGMVMGAFAQGILKGFVSVEAVPMGSRGQYRDLTSLHVSEDRRGNGIGRQLFWPPQNGQRKTEGRNCTFPPTPQWKPRHFIRPWGVKTQKNIPKNM